LLDSTTEVLEKIRYDDSDMLHFNFGNWMFLEEECNPIKMARAGFYACGGTEEPDLVRCVVCRKELEGWEPSDDPWEEHKSHARGKCSL